MAKTLSDELLWPAALVGLVIGIVLGSVVSYWAGEFSERELLGKDDLRRECIVGNDRACKVYEVDYGRD